MNKIIHTYQLVRYDLILSLTLPPSFGHLDLNTDRLFATVSQNYRLKLNITVPYSLQLKRFFNFYGVVLQKVKKHG